MRYTDMGRQVLKHLKIWLLGLLLMATSGTAFSQNSHPVHVSVQVLPPYGVYLSDYYSGTRDRLIVTLLNRDQGQDVLQVKLRITVKNGSSLSLQSRNELHYPVITLERGIPLRLTNSDIVPYLAPDRITMNGYLQNGKLPTGMTEFSVQAFDYITGRALSDVSTGRAWLETKQPPILDVPAKDEHVASSTLQNIRFQWMPRHQGLASTMYEFSLKELPDNGAAPQSAFLYGNPVYQTQTRFTTLNYTHLEPLLTPGKLYGWQVRAIALDGVDEIGLFDNDGYSEVGWFHVSDNCPAPMSVTAQAGYRKMTLQWQPLSEQISFIVEYRAKSEQDLYEWTSDQTFDSEYTASQLTSGWTYEYRVGALGVTQQPVYSPIGEVTLPLNNEERLAKCGIKPSVDLSNQEPKENLVPGDVVIIGGDFPMTLTQVSSQGNGWFSGKGWITISWIFEIDVAVKFSRLRVNTDNRQIGGEVETETDPKASQIANTNELDSGGNATTPAAKIEFPTIKLDFTLPENPVAEFDSELGELIIYDTNGTPHVIDTPENGVDSIFPMIVEDENGNKYQIDLPEDADNAGTPTITEYDKDGEQKQEQEQDNDNIQESNTAIAKDDLSLYVAIKEIEVNSKGKAAAVSRNYENNETVILPAGKYNFKISREYVEVKEGAEEQDLESAPSSIKHIRDLKILALSSDRTRRIIQDGTNNEVVKTRPYVWQVGADKREEKDEIDYSFSNSGNHVIEVETRTLSVQKGKANPQGQAEEDGYLQILGIADRFRLNVLILDPEPVYFTRGDNYTGEYGFDNYEKVELRDSYETLEIPKANGQTISYAVPYISMVKNQPCNIFASVLVTKEYLKALAKDTQAYTFTCDDKRVKVTANVTNLKEGVNKIPLSIVCDESFGYNAPQIIVAKDMTGQIVGRLTIYCDGVIVANKPINLVKIYLGDDRPVHNTRSASALVSDAITYMNNRAYNQLFVELKPGKIEEYVISNDMLEKEGWATDRLFNDKGEISNSVSDRDILSIIEKILDKNYNFVMPANGNNIFVIANRNRAETGGSRTAGVATGSTIVLYHSGSVDLTTYVHEMGHALGLKHPFEDGGNSDKYLIRKGSSQNYMDYTPNSNMFWKWQWDIMRQKVIIDNSKNN